jgi:hypothetical protein
LPTDCKEHSNSSRKYPPKCTINIFYHDFIDFARDFAENFVLIPLKCKNIELNAKKWTDRFSQIGPGDIKLHVSVCGARGWDAEAGHARKFFN